MKTIGRKADEKLEVASWEELWKLDGHAMKKAAIPVRDRRYVPNHCLWVSTLIWHCIGTSFGVLRNTDKGLHLKSLLIRPNLRRRTAGASSMS